MLKDLDQGLGRKWFLWLCVIVLKQSTPTAGSKLEKAHRGWVGEEPCGADQDQSLTICLGTLKWQLCAHGQEDVNMSRLSLRVSAGRGSGHHATAAVPKSQQLST